MTQRFMQRLNRTKRSNLGLEALEDRQLLNAGNLLGNLPLSAPLLSSPIPAVEVTLDLTALGVNVASDENIGNLGASVRIAARIGVGDAGLSLAANTHLDPEDGGLSVEAGADLNLGAGGGPLGGDADLHLLVDLDHDQGLGSEVDVDLDLSGDSAVIPGVQGGAGLLLTVEVGIGLAGAGSSIIGGPAVNGPFPASLGNGNQSQRFGGNPNFLYFFGATGDRDDEQIEAAALDETEYLEAGESLQQDAIFLLANPFGDERNRELGEEPVGYVSSIVPWGAGVILANGESTGEMTLDGFDLPPEEAGLLAGGAFDTLLGEQALEQFLAWFGGLGEDLSSWWAKLGIPPWVFLALVAAAGAGEVARRNLRKLQRDRIWDETFASLGQL